MPRGRVRKPPRFTHDCRRGLLVIVVHRMSNLSLRGAFDCNFVENNWPRLDAAITPRAARN